MPQPSHSYVIVGGGLAGASAIEGIREIDKNGAILLIGTEPHLPYHRPPLSKKLWLGKTTPDRILVHDRNFYDQHGVTLVSATVTAINAKQRHVTASDGKRYTYEKLLLATGGTPRRLGIPGGDFDGICYFRTLDDYTQLRAAASPGKSAVVVGGGFIGSEMAAALALNQVEVTMLFPGPTIGHRIYPAPLGHALADQFGAHGVRLLANEKPVSITKSGGRFTTVTTGGKRIESDLLVIGIGIEPAVELATAAGLETHNGIVLNDQLQSSEPTIYAAGDNAFFPYRALGKSLRVEHWDNALNQGKQAGRNMAGAGEAYTYMPYFFSDLFDFGYEAVGECDTRLQTFADWQSEYRKGVIYYLAEAKVRGVMLCNVWGKVDAARELIRRNEDATPERLRGAIR